MKIGIAGMGRMGRFHLERLCMTKFNCQLLPFWDPDFCKPIDIGPHHLDPAEDWNSFISQPGLETVLLCTPSEKHFEQLSSLVKAGITVFVEHPICLTLDHVKQIQGLNKFEKLKIRLLPNQFNHSDFLYARETVKADLIGEVLSAEISSCGAKLIGVDLNPLQLLEMTSLYLDQFLQLVPNKPESVFASSTEIFSGEFPLEHLSLTFLSGQRDVGRIQISTNSIVPSRAEWKIEATKGGYFEEQVYSRTDEEEIYHQAASKLTAELPEESLENILSEELSGENSELERALLVVQILHSIQESLKSGNVIPI